MIRVKTRKMMAMMMSKTSVIMIMMANTMEVVGLSGIIIKVTPLRERG